MSVEWQVPSRALAVCQPSTGLTGAVRNGWLDVARGLSAAAVAIFHFNEPIEFENNFYQVVAKYGWLGVISFFVISGFCVRQTADRCSSLR